MSDYNRGDRYPPPPDDYPPNDPRNRPRHDRYPPEDRYPPGRDRHDPYEPRSSRRDDYYEEEEAPRRRAGGLEVPDLRRRSSYYGSGRSDRDRYDDNDDYDEDQEPAKPQRKGFLGISGWDWVFVLALLFAAFRGRREGAGCMPGRGCINTLLLNVAGIFLIFGAIYVNDTGRADGSVATALGALGCGACTIGVGGVFLLIWATVRLIDFGGFDDGGDSDGLLGSIMGRFT